MMVAIAEHFFAARRRRPVFVWRELKRSADDALSLRTEWRGLVADEEMLLRETIVSWAAAISR